METFSTLLALLMMFSAAAASAECDLTGIYGTSDGVMSVDVITDGCWTNFITKNGTQVHILNVHFTPGNDYPMMTVNTAAPSILILTTTDTHFKTIYVTSNFNSIIKIYADNKTLSYVKCEVHRAPAAQGSELISWATEQFGGVSSFTTFHDPGTINFTGTTGTPSAPVCKLSLQLPQMKKSLMVETNKGAVKSCLSQSQESQVEFHIINIPDGVDVRNVSVKVVPSEVKLVLRGPSGTIWRVDALRASLLSNNVVHLLPQLTLNPRTNLSDSDTELQRQALSHFKSKAFTRYTKILLNSPMISIKIEKNQLTNVTKLTTASPPTYTRMQLFKTSDYTLDLDPTTKVQTNTRIYAQITSLIHENSFINIKVMSCLVHCKGIQPVERKISFKTEPCSACYNNTRFSFSFDALKDLPPNIWELQCQFSHCSKNDNKSCAQPQLVKRTVQVTPSYIPPQNQCIEFSLQSVLGIAFGGFLIGVLLIGTLWLIKIRTGYPVALGFGSSRTFFSGCPCSLTKRHAVPTNPSPSENSSANGSMSSTQSTPTSSMA